MENEFRYITRSLFLLSLDQVVMLPIEFRRIKASEGFNGDIDKKSGTVYWWTNTALKNPIQKKGVHIVFSDGSICRCVSQSSEYCNKGTMCDAEWVGVVPAMHVSIREINTMKRDEEGHILYGLKASGERFKWNDISEYMDRTTILMAECLPEAMRFDKKFNNYDKSEIKKYLSQFTFKEL